VPRYVAELQREALLLPPQVFFVVLGCLLLLLAAVPRTSTRLDTAEEVAAAAASHSLDGFNAKTFIVTGGSSGIGEETARVLALFGGTVVVASRDVRRGEAAVARINALVSKSGGAGRAVFELLDLASFESVERFADRWVASNNSTALSAIILNAGLISREFGTTIDGIEQTLQVCAAYNRTERPPLRRHRRCLLIVGARTRSTREINRSTIWRTSFW
jgi:hypothetical protein